MSDTEVPPREVEPAGPHRRGQPRGHGISARWWIAAAAVVVVAVGVVAFVSYGHLGPSGSPQQQMRSWVSASDLSQDLGILHQDTADLQKVLNRHGGTGAVRTVCGVMSVDAQSGNSNLPSPDTRLTQLLARGFELYYQAGDNCYDAGAGNARLLAKSATQQAQAGRLFVEALARVAEVDGQSVATTTTTNPTATTGVFG